VLTVARRNYLIRSSSIPTSKIKRAQPSLKNTRERLKVRMAMPSEAVPARPLLLIYRVLLPSLRKFNESSSLDYKLLL